MKILSHRGYWGTGFPQNSKEAFLRSIHFGFGTETDVRDCFGDIVISHDTPRGLEMKLKELLKIFENKNLPLAINIKADGLAKYMQEVFQDWPKDGWFVFDMSVPDMLAHLRIGNPVFTRISDIEISPIAIDRAIGVWVDGFKKNFENTETIKSLLSIGKKLCFVSPELHGRDHIGYWSYLRQWSDNPLVMLCTDFPEEASQFFETNYD